MSIANHRHNVSATCLLPFNFISILMITRAREIFISISLYSFSDLSLTFSASQFAGSRTQLWERLDSIFKIFFVSFEMHYCP